MTGTIIGTVSTNEQEEYTIQVNTGCAQVAVNDFYNEGNYLGFSGYNCEYIVFYKFVLYSTTFFKTHSSKVAFNVN